MLAIACLLPSAYMAWAGRDMPALGHLHEDSVFWMTAGSLAQGHGYRIMSLPEQPWQTKYPPLLPLYLSLVWRIAPRFPQNLPLATLFCWMWMPVWLALAWRALRDLGVERGPALAFCFLMAVSSVAIKFSLSIATEMMFSALWLGSVAILPRARSVRVALAAGALAGAAYLTKTAALPLLVAAPLYFVLRRRYRLAVAVAAGMLPAVAGWNLWMHAHMGRPSDPLLIYYTDYFRYQLYNIDFRMVPSLLAKNGDALLQSVGQLLIGPTDVVPERMALMALIHPAMRIVCVLAIAGWYIRVRRRGMTPYDLFACFYVPLLLVWHYPPNERFLFPLMPVLLAGCWEGMRAAGALLANRIPVRRAISVTLAAAVCSWMALGWLGYYRFLGDIREATRLNREAFAWISRNTAPGAIFVAHDDVVLYLYTGRTGYRPIVPTRFLYDGDLAAAEGYVRSLPELARRHRAGYILSGPRDWFGEYLVAGLPLRSHRLLAAAGLPVAFHLGAVTVYGVPGAPTGRTANGGRP